MTSWYLKAPTIEAPAVRSTMASFILNGDVISVALVLGGCAVMLRPDVHGTPTAANLQS